MIHIKSSLIKVLSVFCVVCSFALAAFGATALTVQEKLEKGQRLYEAGDYEHAMDNFLDVFVEGNIEQINIANEYVNMIHFKRGGVSTPIRVTYDEELEVKKEAYKQEAKEIQQEIAEGYDNTVNYARESLDSAKNEAKDAVEASQQELSQLKKQAQEEIDAQLSYAQAVPQEAQTFAAGVQTEEVAADPKTDSVSAQQELVAVEASQSGEEIIAQDKQVNDIEKQAEIIITDIASMKEKLISKLNKAEGVNVYLREGEVDAIDIDSSAIFLDDKINFSAHGKEILHDIYNLMLISKAPVFVLLPPGSYTDEVNLQGIRQVVALNSYLINMGLSSAKLNFNMGLINEQPPAKFSNLEGISIVFDYDNSPSLYNRVSDKQAYPILSLGMYPEKINTELEEIMVIDFSVIETSAPIESWKFQIIQHAKDGKYYIVRQISGADGVYGQVFWNGKKQFFGAALPAGKYTLMLRAKDTQGKEKVVRRKVEIVSNVKEEKIATETPKPVKASKKAVLDYTTPRLWTKPAKILKNKNALPQEDVEVFEEVSIEDNSTTQGNQTQYSAATAEEGVVNPSSSPTEQDSLAYDPSLEELL